MKTLLGVIAALMAAPCFANAEPTIQWYGFAKVSYLATGTEFDADHKPVSVLSTAGLTPEAESLRKTGRAQITAKHSRFGVTGDNGDSFKARLEFDLDGEPGNQVGVTSSNLGILRVRLANFSYAVNENGTITFGKKWEIFSPVQPHTYQFTTIQFWAGNTGFLTDGIDYIHKSGDATYAVELKNIGADPATLKLSGPALTLRGDYKFGEHLLGLSVLGGKLAYAKQDVVAPFSDQDRQISGVNVYYSGKISDRTEIIAEIYGGKNLGAAVVGALAQAPKAQAATDAKGEDNGGYISVKHKFETWALYGGIGRASYNEETSVASSRNSLLQNAMARIGMDHTFSANTVFYTELASVNSTYVEASEKKSYTGGYLDVGVVARF